MRRIAKKKSEGERKKDMGGKYNEKFFINVHDVGEEFADVPEGADE